MSRRIKKDTTFRFPFDIDTRYFLGLAAVFFLLSIKPVSEFFYPKLTIPKLKNKIEKDVLRKLDHFDELLKDTALVNRAYSQTLSNTDFKTLDELDYAVYFYEKGMLKCWNKTFTKNPLDTFANNKPSPYKDSNGHYIVYQHNYSDTSIGRNIIALYKIKNENGIENKYFTKNFLVGDKENDFNLELALSALPKSMPIVIRDIPQFHIFKNDDFLTVNDKSGWRLFFIAAPFILFGVSVHTYFKVESKKKNIKLIYGLLLATIVVIRGITYLFGFPNDFSEFGLFSPEYFASDTFNRSLGDLSINMCLLFWALLFFIINVQSRIYDWSRSKLKGYFGVFIFLAGIVANLYLSNLVYRLTRDSVINFDTTLFYNLDIFSIVGILTFMVICINFLCVTVIVYNYLSICWTWKYAKYITLLILFIVYIAIGLGRDDDVCYFYVFLSSAGLFLLQDLNYLKTKFDFNSYKILILLLLISAGGALFLTILIEKKELVERERYAESLLVKDSAGIEDTLNARILSIEGDSLLRNLVQSSLTDQKKISDYLKLYHLKSEAVNYDLEIQLQADTTIRTKELEVFVDSNKKFNSFSFVENVRYKLYPLIETQQGNVRLSIEMTKKVSTAINEYDDLLMPSKTSDLLRNDAYSYAFYKNGKLLERKGSYIFPYRLAEKKKDFDANNKLLITRNDYSELWLQSEDKRNQVVMLKSKNSFFLFTTLYAYIFFTYFVVITLYILGNIIARSNLNYKRFINLLSINLRLRIHFSILAVELGSFIVIGYFTSYFLIDNVNEKMMMDLSKYSYSIQRDVRKNEVIGNAGQGNSDSSIDISVIEKIASVFSINLNLYNVETGKLLYSSLPELYQHQVLSDHLDAAVFYKAKQGTLNNVINEEEIGLLKFLSSYFVIRNNQGKEIGIIQLPFFLSTAEIKSETTTIITTLINIYIFVFLISAIIAFFLTKSVTRPFTYIVKQFTKINLSKTNEPLKWFDSDEIGLLIKEYNRMLRKLENSTVLLAKNEREMAWREMAKQVAHEIKNPLTPMKLSLQMLERAIKNNATNVNETAIKVTKTLVEQIDNLSLIATNFSNFAKLPASKNEIFPLNEFLYSVTGMYHDDVNNEFLFMIPDYEINLYADKSQIMRVFTNIIQNAIQSIPEDRKGNIALTVSKIKNHFIRVSISDNGEGITPEKAANLFQPYFTTKTSGTGLGLAMCKDIIEDTGGRITFESVIDDGTTFHIDLPIYMGE